MSRADAKVSFEKILTSTLRMLSGGANTRACLFLQWSDDGLLHIRAADGVPRKLWAGMDFDPKTPAIAECLSRNRVVLWPMDKQSEALKPIRKLFPKGGDNMVLVPVKGEHRALGALLVGPYKGRPNLKSREKELKSAGALCAVISANWRMYEWMDQFMPQVNHHIRTPLTAIQGSINMALGGLFGQVDGELKTMLEMAQKGCERTVRAIEDYLNTRNLPKT